MKRRMRGVSQLTRRRQSDIWRLGPEHRPALFELLDREPVTNVFLRSELRLGARLDSWWGVGGADGLTAVVMGGPLVVPWIPDLADVPEVASALSRQPPPRLIIGPAPAARALVASMMEDRRPTEVRDPQPVLVLDRVPPVAAGVHIRRARTADLDQLTAAAAAMHREEMGVDPLALDAAGWRRRMATLVDRGWSFLLLEGDEIAFKVELSAWTPEAVQLQGVWTDPRRRRRGLAKAALAAVCAELLRDVPLCSLYVNAYNEPALQLYRRLGFRQVGEFATVIY